MLLDPMNVKGAPTVPAPGVLLMTALIDGTVCVNVVQRPLTSLGPSALWTKVDQRPETSDGPSAECTNVDHSPLTSEGPSAECTKVDHSPDASVATDYTVSISYAKVG